MLKEELQEELDWIKKELEKTQFKGCLKDIKAAYRYMVVGGRKIGRPDIRIYLICNDGRHVQIGYGGERGQDLVDYVVGWVADIYATV